MPRADVIGDGHVDASVMYADETAFVPKAKTHETGVSDDDALKAIEFVEAERTHVRLRDGLAPARCPRNWISWT